MSASARAASAVLCVVAAFVVGRGSVASAIAVRGDEALRAGRTSAALGYYGRAYAVDRSVGALPDRFALLAMIAPTREVIDLALRVTREGVRERPADAAVRLDLALIEWKGRRYALAARDFAEAGRRGAGVRALRFAQAAARRARARSV